MARTEPRFVDHLRERFVEPMKVTQREHDDRETDDYAAEFIRAVMLLGEVRVAKAKEPERNAPMEDLTSKSVAVFSQPFTVPGFDETLSAGEYEIETELVSPPDQQDPAAWKASVLVKLHPRVSHPGLARTLTVSLADLDHARAKDKLTGRALTDFFLEEMLADPMVRLVMEADGVSEAHLRHLYSGSGTSDPNLAAPPSKTTARGARDEESIQTAENEGMPTRPDSPPSLRTRLAAGKT